MGARSLFIPLHNISGGRTLLLPFLYQTWTIQAPSRWSSVVQRSFHTTPRRRRDAIPFEEEPAYRRPGQSSPYPNHVTPQCTPHDPFAEDESPSPQRTTTITASEKVIFDRIFDEISVDASKKVAEAEDPLDDRFDAGVPAKHDAYSDLDAIFDDAINELRRESQREMDRQQGEEKRLNIIPKDYEMAIKRYANFKRLDLSELRQGKHYKTIQRAVVHHRRRVLAMLEDAPNDVKLWEVLDTEVFALSRQYDSLKRNAEKAKKSKGRRGRTSKADQEAVAGAEQEQSDLAADKTKQEAEVEAILSSNYGDYCLAAMRNLRREYPASPYCMTLLPTIKRLGPISHVLAVSVDLYNELLFLMWKEYSDLHGMADLIVEMGNQGLQGNEVTLAILKMVRNAKLFAFAEDKPMKKWWTFYPVDQGYKRLKLLARDIQRDITQSRVKRSVEEIELENGTTAELPLDAEGDRGEEVLGNTGARMKSSIADEGTVWGGGLGESPSQRVET
ncbi:MAG: hypothetical protein L6R39_000647 [Caloplaca ligustica]|nr:MAG: hypothetical protein L6R39_000647 [Caloplaca ligustica]